MEWWRTSGEWRHCVHGLERERQRRWLHKNHHQRTGDQFFADSLSITNIATKSTVSLFVKGTTFLTNGPGALVFAGATTSGANLGVISLIFSNSVTFNTATFTGQAGNATLTFAGGTVTGSNLTFSGGSGVNKLIFTAPLNLSSNLTVTGGDANNTVLIASNSSVAGRLSVGGDLSSTPTSASPTPP